VSTAPTKTGVTIADYQASLFGDGPEAGISPLRRGLRRTELSDGAWVELRTGWVIGADRLFERLLAVVPWRAERRPMYDRVVAVPRLLCSYGEGEPLPDPMLAIARDLLGEHYRPELGEPLTTTGMCLYRDGRDSVAWHGDNSGRRPDTTIVAIVSLGTPRGLALRPVAGNQALRFELGHGDLLVMGGTCQRTWQHAVPKSARVTGPRISIQFRPSDVH
jgi:alkylated DNA repair dioxygenase AlkB